MTNDVLQVIHGRYSCRAFTDAAPSREQLEAIANAAITAPSGMNRQEWQVIVVRDRALLQEMEEAAFRTLKAMEDQTMYERILSRGGAVLYHTPAIVMIAIKPGTEMDCGILCQTVVLAAESLGLNSLICGMARLCFASEKGAEFRDRLGFREDYEFGTAVLLGTAEKPGERRTPDASKISWVE